MELVSGHSGSFFRALLRRIGSYGVFFERSLRGWLVGYSRTAITSRPG